MAVERAYAGDRPLSERRARKAAEAGHAKGMTVYGLGLALLGRYEEAHIWLTEAAAAGDPVGLAALVTLEVERGQEQRAMAHLRRGEAEFGALSMRIALLQVWTRRTVPFDAEALPGGVPDPALDPSPTAYVRRVARAGSTPFEWAQLRKQFDLHPATDSSKVILALVIVRIAEGDMALAHAWCTAAVEGCRGVWNQTGPRPSEPPADVPMDASGRPAPDGVPAEKWQRALHLWEELHELCGGVDEAAQETILPDTPRHVSAEAAKYLGSCAAQKGDLTTAQAWLERAAREGDPEAMLLVAEVVRDRFGMTRAEPRFREAADAGSAPAMHLYAEHLRGQGRPVEAEGYFRRAVAEGSTDSLLNLGVLLRHQGDDAGAETYYRRAMEVDDRATRANGHNNLANLLHARGDDAAAEPHWRTAAQEGNPAAMASLGALCAQRGDLAAAERWFRSSAGAGDTAGMLNLAHVLKRRGAMGEAAEWLTRAASADASGPAPPPERPFGAADIDDRANGPDGKGSGSPNETGRG
ncbi:tetratricopeptide repeat protein [Streptomyces sp. NPDC046215]|uniref:tetratricopeptide repeat protein n=1 Tax=Streptomyces TaxID=1883 RepID=UPI0031DE259A